MKFKVGDRVKFSGRADDGAFVFDGVKTVTRVQSGVIYPYWLGNDSYSESELLPVDAQSGRRLTVTQGTNTTVFEGDFTYDVEDLDAYVQVTFPNSPYAKYTYRDESRTLSVGDYVLVPVGTGNKEKVAEVKALGRGAYKGNVVKGVIARLAREELVAA